MTAKTPMGPTTAMTTDGGLKMSSERPGRSTTETACGGQQSHDAVQLTSLPSVGFWKRVTDRSRPRARLGGPRPPQIRRPSGALVKRAPGIELGGLACTADDEWHPAR